METTKILKIAVFALIIGYSLYQYWKKKRLQPETDFIKIDDNRGNEILIDPKISDSDFKAIIETDKEKAYDKYNNPFYKLSALLLDPLSDLSNARSEEEYYGMMDTSQRIYSLLLQFDGQINNGGLYQFFWNRTHAIYALGEALAAINIKPLKSDYNKAVKEFEAYADQFVLDRKVWNDTSATEEEKWTAFKRGYDHIPTAKIIEDYFYTYSFSEKFHQAAIDYIIKHKKHFGVKT